MAISLFSSNLTKLENESFHDFTERLIDEIQQIPNDNLISVFPEYCWGNSSIDEILLFMDNVKDEEANGKAILFGSAPFAIKSGDKTNNAILLHDNSSIHYFPKSHLTAEETRRHQLVGGTGSHQTKIGGIKIGILICADLWDAGLVKNLIIKNKIQILAVPAFTVVPIGFAQYARYQWFSLCLTRSREFVLPIVVADHSYSTPNNKFSVGGITNIIDPSIKHKNIKTMEDFFTLPLGTSVSSIVNLEKVAKYRIYRSENRMYHATSKTIV